MSVYLDHNATTPVLPAVVDAITEALSVTGNASSVHGRGRAARAVMERARTQLAVFVNVASDRIVFTSGGTEANNLAIRGSEGRRVLVSAVEHDSVFKVLEGAAILPVDGQGVVDLDSLDRQLAADDRPALVSVMLANNETGVIQPIAEISAITRRHGAQLHVDAVQAAAKLPVDMISLGADFLTLSAHKFGGPQGAGAVVLGEGLTLTPLLKGGGQERGQRSGTENLPAIAGFGLACELAPTRLAAADRIAALRDRFEARARKLIPETRIFSEGASRLCNTSCLTMPGVDAETQLMALDLAGVMVGSGAACSSGKVEPSRVLRALGATAEEARQAIRVSLGPETSEVDLDQFFNAWAALWARKTHRGAAPQQSATAA